MNMSVQQLSSLRVTVSMDPGEYVRGAAQVEQSNKQMAVSGQVTGGGIEKLTGQVKLLQQQMDALRAANDNAKNSLGGMIGGVKDIGSSVENTAAGILTTVSHLKLLGAAAYALSPAFRGVINSGVALAFGAMGTAAAAATRTVIGFAAPALSFFARLTIPIGIAVAAWELLNAVVTTGSGLLAQYGNAQRSLVANVDDNLKKLTKYQGDIISAQDVKFATDLAGRMTEAKRSINDFFSVSLDLTAPALRFQNVWVVILETISKALDKIGQIPGAMAAGAQAVGKSSIWNNLGLDWGWNLPGKDKLLATTQTDSATSNADAMTLARQRLTGGMGGQSNFAVRYGQSINDLANPPKPEDKTATKDPSDAWDRATASIEKHSAKLSADTLAFGQSTAVQEGLRAEFSLLEAAKLSDRDVTDEQIQAYTQYRASMSASQALQAAGIKWSDDERAAFDRTTASIKARTTELEKAKIAESITFGQRTMFLTSEDVQIANQLKTLYGNDIPAAMASSQAAALRLNQAVSTTSQQISGGLTTALTDVAMGTKTAGQAFADFGQLAIRAIEQMIIQLTIVGPLMRGLTGGLGGGLFGGLFGSGGGTVTGSASGSAGATFANGGVMTSRGQLSLNRYSGGGVATSPQLAIFGEGRTPEAYVPLPDGRSIPVNINVPKGAGSSGPVTNISPVYNIDARGSTMTEAQFQAILAKNNAQLAKDINNSLPDRVAAINRDPRAR
jgi:hypothetical protein